jgi:hypothetical protein
LLADAGQTHIAAEDGHGFKERGRVFAAADGDADGLKGLPGLQTKLRGCCSKSLVERIVIEVDGGEEFKSVLEDAAAESGVALLRDELGGVVGRELIDEEEIGGGDGVAQELDAFADERGDGFDLLGRGMKARLLEKRRNATAQLFDRQGADVLGV